MLGNHSNNNKPGDVFIERGGQRGQGKGQQKGNRAGAGPGGYCICPACNERVMHQQGVPCYSLECPKCNTKMIRE